MANHPKEIITIMDDLKTKLLKAGLSEHSSNKLISQVEPLLKSLSSEQCWQKISREHLSSKLPFSVHFALYTTIYPDWEKLPAPAWLPDEKFIKNTHIAQLMQEKGYKNIAQDYPNFHQWSANKYADFWRKMTSILNIQFDSIYTKIIDFPKNIETPRWFPDAKLNIANSCFQAKQRALAIISQAENGKIIKTTYDQLDQLSNQIAHSLSPYLQKGDRAAIIMPMTREAVAIFLALIKAGCVVVAVPDSFSPKEIEARLQIAEVKLVFCQDQIIRGGKILPFYEKIIQSNSPQAVILPATGKLILAPQRQDLSWEQFLTSEEKTYPYISCDPQDHINILFSSGTTGAPKAIPWNHTTPIKCASDAYLHHDLQAGDVFCWPTNLGWMMGPWLIFACLINKATIALYEGAPMGKGFAKFVSDAQVSHLGVVPTMVKHWRTSRCMEGYHWKSIKLFTSTGERSNIEDMLYLMSLAKYRPVIEYCGGTEIGGAYITGTLVQPCAPAAFTTPALGLDLILLDEAGVKCDKGEITLVSPSIGLSTELINYNHHDVYYAHMPKLPGYELLRRHGDQAEHYHNGFYRLLGRVDDVMKLSGIKISSAEIEACLQKLPTVFDVAAIGLDPVDGGPTQLLIYAVLKPGTTLTTEQLKTEMQNEIHHSLNPLFKIEKVFLIPALPRTASNKIMRRVLRTGSMTHDTH